jgi:hypothetical protein
MPGAVASTIVTPIQARNTERRSRRKIERRPVLVGFMAFFQSKRRGFAHVVVQRL